jgi:NAD-specific glutamate dehydrogenase
VQRALAARAARTAPPQEDPAIAQERLTAWLSSLGERAAEAMRIVAEFEASGPWSLAKSTLIAAELRALAEA